VNGVPVSPKDFDISLNKIKEAASISPVCKPTFFEVTFLLAMVVFSENNIDRAIIETGLGGRLDSTRLVDADLCVITTISKDHTEFLGETLEEIAFEKAGIHRPGVPLLLSKSDSLSPSVLKVISDKVGEDLWIIKTNEELSNWQKWSMLTRQIAKFMKWKDSEIKCKWPGRSPEYGSSWYDFPVKVCAAHNKEGFESELNSVEKPSVFIIGITEKADIKDTLSPFLKENLHQSIFHHLIFTEPLSGRNDSVNAEELENIICRHRETPRDIIKNPINAIEEASKICEIDDVELVIIGSVYLVGDILNYIISRDNLNFWEELRVHR
jgi:folylpolyglutamate synthase/dihydropteroate synthase